MNRLSVLWRVLSARGVWRSQLGLSYAPTSQKMSIPTVPYISIRPNYLSSYSLPEHRRVRTVSQQNNQLNLAVNAHGGRVSKKANRRIRQAIDWLLYLSKDKDFTPFKSGKVYQFKVNFVTLTLCARQAHSDQFIKKHLLQPFLDYGRKVWKIDNYVWRAEPQKNGNIHFHLVTDVYIPWNELRNEWNKLQAKLGYVRRFQARHGHKTPNGTDIHSVRKVRNLSIYLAEYFAKDSPVRAIAGKQWGLSYKLSRLKSATDVRYSDIEDELRELFRLHGNKIRKSDFHTCLFISISEWINKGFAVLESVLSDYLLHVFDPKIPDRVSPGVPGSPEPFWAEPRLIPIPAVQLSLDLSNQCPFWQD